jgi:hypothetical protein
MSTRLRGWLPVAVWASSLAGCVEGGPTGDRSAAPAVSSVPRPGAGGVAAPPGPKDPVARSVDPARALAEASVGGGAGGVSGASSGAIASDAAPRRPALVAAVEPPGTSGRPIAVILVMPPREPRDGDRPAGPLTFKVSLTADARTASIEMDGHPVGSTPVQRVYAVEGARRAPARGPSPRSGVARPGGPWPPPVWPGPAFPPAPPGDSGRDALPASILTPNGAPIID